MGGAGHGLFKVERSFRSLGADPLFAHDPGIEGVYPGSRTLMPAITEPVSPEA
jgi:hypothetical protein